MVIGNDAAIDAAFLDPPYNVRINGHANAKGRHREFAMASGEMTDEGFRVFLAETLAACARVSREGAVHFVCMDWRHMGDVGNVGERVYGELLNLCVWNKSNAGMGSLYRSKHELIFVYRVGAAPHPNMVELGKHGRNRTNVWDYASVNSFVGGRKEDLDLHPTVKPTSLVRDALQDVTKRGDLVLDIFLGSGTTLIAAERSGAAFAGSISIPRTSTSQLSGGRRSRAERHASSCGQSMRKPLAAVDGSAATRFKKGQSGNPKGRPLKPKPVPSSPFPISTSSSPLMRWEASANCRSRTLS